MNVRKASMLVSGWVIGAVLLAPLVGCDHHHRYSRSSRYEDSRSAEVQRNREEQRRRDHDHDHDHDRGNY